MRRPACDSDTHPQGGDADAAPFMGSAGRKASPDLQRTLPQEDVAKVAASLTDLRDHHSRAYRAETTVFLEGMTNTSVRLAKGEHLFVLTDSGVEEAGHSGPDEILIITEKFGSWPVVALKVRSAHLPAWRDLPAGVHALMMRRVRNALRARSHLLGEKQA